tara:strand:+ start:741 stop:935 length:195 start_codon:yes stop_codon:yes gene_type:complete
MNINIEITLKEFEALVGNQHGLPDDEPRSSVVKETYTAHGVTLKAVTNYYSKAVTQYYIQDINE